MNNLYLQQVVDSFYTYIIPSFFLKVNENKIKISLNFTFLHFLSNCKHHVYELRSNYGTKNSICNV